MKKKKLCQPHIKTCYKNILMFPAEIKPEIVFKGRTESDKIVRLICYAPLHMNEMTTPVTLNLNVNFKLNNDRIVRP